MIGSARNAKAKIASAERVAAVGSRAYPRLDLVEAFVVTLPDGAVVVSRGARSVDGFAELATSDFEVVVPSRLDPYGPKPGARSDAGFRRRSIPSLDGNSLKEQSIGFAGHSRVVTCFEVFEIV